MMLYNEKTVYYKFKKREYSGTLIQFVYDPINHLIYGILLDDLSKTFVDVPMDKLYTK